MMKSKKKQVIRCNIFKCLPSVYFVLMAALLYILFNSCISCALTSRTLLTMDSVQAEQVTYEKLDTLVIHPFKK